jgi:hypothetical protein
MGCTTVFHKPPRRYKTTNYDKKYLLLKGTIPLIALDIKFILEKNYDVIRTPKLSTLQFACIGKTNLI